MLLFLGKNEKLIKNTEILTKNIYESISMNHTMIQNYHNKLGRNIVHYTQFMVRKSKT